MHAGEIIAFDSVHTRIFDSVGYAIDEIDKNEGIQDCISSCTRASGPQSRWYAGARSRVTAASATSERFQRRGVGMKSGFFMLIGGNKVAV